MMRTTTDHSMAALDGTDGGGLELAILGRVWQFGRGDGSVISPTVRLVRGGHVAGHPHSNESNWRIEDSALEFTNPEGDTTCRFDAPTFDESGAMILQGRFLRKEGVIHVLREVGAYAKHGPPNTAPRVALLVRTHLVNDKLFDLLDLLSRSRRYDLFVSADETRHALDVRGFAKLGHTVNSCAEHELCTQHDNILWHCGDYPLYFAAREIPDYDYYMMIEYDVDLVRRSPLFIEGILSRLQFGEAGCIDWVSQNTGVAYKDWYWAAAGRRMFPAVHSCGIFAFVVVSKRALNYLLQTRRKEAEAGATDDDIVHCEAFCVSALIDGGFKCVPVNALIDNAVDGASFRPGFPDNPEGNFLLNHYRVEDPRVEIVHPVIDLNGFLGALYRKAAQGNDLDSFLTQLQQIPHARQQDADIIAQFRDVALANLQEAR